MAVDDHSAFDRMKRNAGSVIEAVCESVRRSVLEDEDAIALKTANEEREYCTICAAAAMIEAKVPDSRIGELLTKYFRLDDKEVAHALGKGHLMAERKKPGKTAKPKR